MNKNSNTRLAIGLLIGLTLLLSAASFALMAVERSLDAKVEQVEQIRLEQKRTVLAQIQVLNKANPKQDFARAWSKRDYRFIGDYGQMYSVPGVTKEQANFILRQKNVNFIKGTGDGIDTAEESELHRLAVGYATRYNRLLLKRLNPR